MGAHDRVDVDLDQLQIPDVNKGSDALTWLLEQADWRSPVDSSLGRLDLARESVGDMGERLGAVLLDSLPHPGTAPPAGNLRILNLISENAASLALPWELANYAFDSTISDWFLVNRVPRECVGYEEQQLGSPLSIVTTAPRPLGDHDLRRANTQSPLLQVAAQHGSNVRVKAVRPATFEDMVSAIRDQHFAVVHFDGHGVTRPDGRVDLLFESQSAGHSLVAAEVMIELVAGCRPDLIIMNACRSGWSSGMPSLAFSIAAAVPGVQVIAMSHAIDLDTAATLLHRFFPALASGSQPVQALASAKLHLRRSQSFDDEGPPNHLIPVLYGPPLSNLLEEDSDQDQPITGPQVTVYDWETELHKIDDLLEASENEQIVVRGPLLCGKSTLIDLVGQYRLLVGAGSSERFRERILEERDCWTPAPERSVTIGQAPIAVGSRWWTSLCSSGEVAPEDFTILQGTLGHEAVYMAGSHLGTMRAISELLETMDLGAAVDELKWGAASDLPSPSIDVVDNAFAVLDEAELRTVIRAGCIGGLVAPSFLAYVNSEESVDLADGAVEHAFQSLKKLAIIGLAQPYLHDGALLLAIGPLVAHRLRHHLRLLEGEQELAATELKVVRLAFGLADGRPKLDDERSRPAMLAHHQKQDEQLTLMEQLLDRAIGTSIRVGDDSDAARLASAVTAGLAPSTAVYRRALGLLVHRVAYDAGLTGSLPATKGACALAQARASEADERWDDVLKGVTKVRASLAESQIRLIAEPRLLVMEARASWRIGRSTDASVLLDRADELAHGNESLELAVRYGREDFEVFTTGRRLSVSTGDPAHTWVDRMRTAEEQGDLADAAAVAAQAAGDAEASKDYVERADALIEQGRLLYRLEDARAIEVLEEALRLQSILGRPTERLLYLVGSALGRAGRYEEATRSLDHAWTASSYSGREANQADIVFERGNLLFSSIVATNPDIAPDDERLQAAADLYEQARQMYEHLSRPALAAGAAAMLAQVLAEAGKRHDALEAISDAERLANQHGGEQARATVDQIAEAIRRPSDPG